MKYDHYLIITPKGVVHIHLRVVHNGHILLHMCLQVSFVLYAIDSMQYVNEYFYLLNDEKLLFRGRVFQAEVHLRIFDWCDISKDQHHQRDEMQPKNKGDYTLNLFVARDCIERSAAPALCSLPVKDAGRNAA